MILPFTLLIRNIKVEYGRTLQKWTHWSELVIVKYIPLGCGGYVIVKYIPLGCGGYGAVYATNGATITGKFSSRKTSNKNSLKFLFESPPNNPTPIASFKVLGS